MKPKATETEVERNVRPVVEAMGLELVDVQIAAEPAGTVLRVLLDRPGGVDLDQLTRATRAIDPVLQRDAPLRGRYRLEVSSPGIERPLRKRTDFQRFEGREAHVRAAAKIEGRRNFTGTIEGIEGDTLRLRVDDATFRIPFDQIVTAHLVVEV